MQQTPYGNSALWNMFNQKSVYNPMQKNSPSDVVSQQGGVSNWIQKDMGINANTMSEQDLLGLNNQYERATTNLGNNWEQQRVVDKSTGQDVASNNYYHEPFNFTKDVLGNAALIWGGGYGLSSLFGGAGLGAGGLSGMDLAADAALGTGNNIMTAGAGLGGAGAGTAASSSLFSGGLPKLSTGNSVADQLLGNVAKSFLGGGSGGISNLGNLSSLFSNYKQYSNTGKLMDEIKGIYSPDGPYAKRLEQELGRRDAAAGRNSQYGPRLEELMGRLGDSQARALQGLGPMMATQQGGLNGMLGAGNRLLGDFNLMDLFGGNSLGGMLAGEAGSTPDMWDRVSEDIDWEALFGG